MTPAIDMPPSVLPLQMQAEAQAEASRFYGDGPVAPWRPAGEPRTSWPWARGAAALAAIATAAGVAAWAPPPDAPAITAAPPPHASPIGDPEDDIVDEPAPVRAPSAVVVPGSTAVAVTRRGREWHIEAAGASRLFAAQRLAEATGSSLRGDVSLLASTRPLDLDWQGRNAARAWAAVLGQELSFVTQCSAARCTVWLLQAGDGAAPLLPTPRAAIPLPSNEPAELAAAPTVRQSDSTDPRVAAHHD